MPADPILSRQIRISPVFALFFSIALLVPVAPRAAANTDDPAKASKTENAPVEDYKIGVDDVLKVSVIDAPEFGGKFRVTDSGLIDVPGITGQIHAEGLTPVELSNAIRKGLIDAKQLRDPHVNVFVEEYHGRTVTVLGAVARPAVYALQKKTSVLEALSLAGGTIPSAGNTVTIVRGAASAEATGTDAGSVQVLELSKLVNGKDLAANIEVKNGDVISVSAAQLFYVVGAVSKPGGYTIADPSSGISVVQAIAVAGGFVSVANHHALIVRQSTSDRARVEIPVDIGQMMAGKTTDVVLAPNDILYVPTSGAKQSLKVLGDIAIVAANGVAFYGLGYRVGNY